MQFCPHAGAITGLSDKISRLFTWHLVEVDLVSRQQLQLNKLREEFDEAKQLIKTLKEREAASLAQREREKQKERETGRTEGSAKNESPRERRSLPGRGQNERSLSSSSTSSSSVPFASSSSQIATLSYHSPSSSSTSSSSSSGLSRSVVHDALTRSIALLATENPNSGMLQNSTSLICLCVRLCVCVHPFYSSLTYLVCY